MEVLKLLSQNLSPFASFSRPLDLACTAAQHLVFFRNYRDCCHQNNWMRHLGHVGSTPSNQEDLQNNASISWACAVFP